MSLAWVAETIAHVHVGDLDSALQVAKEATTRFQRTPGAWRRWTDVMRRLADAYREAEEPERARRLLEEAIAADPFDAAGYGFLAEHAWSTGAKDEARAQLERALRLNPEYPWAWNRLIEWSDSGCSSHPVTRCTSRRWRSRPCAR